MSKKIQLVLGLEILFWVLTAAVVFVIMQPIWNDLAAFQFEQENIIVIVIFLTYTRYIFLLKHTFFAWFTPIKVLFIIASIPLTFYLIGCLNGFQTHLDENGPDTFLKYLLPDYTLLEQEGLMKYIKNEFTLFAMGSIVVSIIMPFRMIMSIWRNMNRGTV